MAHTIKWSIGAEIGTRIVVLGQNGTKASEERGGEKPQDQLRRVINKILEGFVWGGETTSARRKHFYIVRSVSMASPHKAPK